MQNLSISTEEVYFYTSNMITNKLDLKWLTLVMLHFKR